MIEILYRRLTLILTFAALALLVVFASSGVATAQKLKAEDVVAKHLESIGPAASRASDHSRVAVGAARAVFKTSGSSGAIDGRAVFGSVQNKVLMAMAFTAPNYPGDKFGFDGKKLTIAYQRPGVRTTLGNFLLSNSAIAKEGLIGGTLSSAWPLLNLAERGAKVSYSGTEKIEGRTVHKLNYSPDKGSDVKISLYFDSETFHHIRTQYELVISTRIAAGGVDNQAGQRETRYKLIENFTDYKKEGELNLPHGYALQFEIFKTAGSSMDKWEIKLEQFEFNQPIDSKSFNVEGD
jgi:outer membrane lipoprotein-sorting protein